METNLRLNEAIILAGGRGTRLRGISGDLPKPMMPVCGKPFLAYLLNFLKNAGTKRVILSVGYKHEIISTYFGAEFRGIPITYSIEDSPLGTGGALAKAFDCTEDNDVAVLNGDSFFEVDIAGLFSYHAKNQADITLAVKYLNDCGRFGSVSIADGKIRAFREKGVADGGYINGGMYIVNRRISAFMPSEQAFSLESDLIEKAVASLEILPFISDGYFVDIGIPDDYRKAQQELSGVTGAEQ